MSFPRTIPILLIACVTLAACGDDEPPRSMEDIDVASPSYNIVNLLTATGNEVEVVGRAPVQYFDAKNVVIRVNGGIDLELYEFGSKEDLEEAAAKVSPDATTIEGKPITWKAPPHFFKTDKVIILYMGADPANVAQLASAFGPQFAGK